MKILSLTSYPQTTHQLQKTTFQANPKTKVINELTDSFTKELSNAIKSGDLANQIKTQMTNTEKKRTFFTVLASLITATAVQITDFITNENKEDKTVIDKKDDEAKHSFEKQHLLKLINHKGRKLDFEINLLNAIDNIIQKLQLQDNDKNNLINLYNKFCGINYKSKHYSPDNELISNSEIVKSLVEDLNQASDTQSLNNIISEYNNYSLEAKERPEESLDSEILKNIKLYPNITKAYSDSTKQNQNKDAKILIESFLIDISNESLPKAIKQKLFKNINNEYSENIYELSTLHNDLKNNNPESATRLNILIANKNLSPRALKSWYTGSYKYNLNFFEYNSMVLNDINDETITEIGKQKRNTKLKEINVITPDKFSISLPFINYKKNFHLINNIFALLHKDCAPLNSNEPDEYNLNDVEIEIKKHQNTYPNLIQHLSIKDKDYLNQGKMQNLLDLYYGDNINKNLFTLHSYLRFIERIVIPSINDSSTMEDANYCKNINKTYIFKVKELKQSLENSFNEPIDVRTYSIENIKAPQFKIQMPSAQDDEISITINNDGKIHTIF